MKSGLLSDITQYAERHSFFLFWFLARYRFRHWTMEDITKYHGSRIRNRIKFALRKSPFYRKHYEGYDISDTGKLPFTSKTIMMDNLSGFNTAGLKKEEVMEFCIGNERSRDFSRRIHGYNAGLSSGTSGNKGVEITSPAEENILRAAFFARFHFPEKQKINLAFILRVTSPAFSLNRFGHRLSYIGQLDSIENIVGKLNEQNPNMISAPPSMLKLLASEKENGRLKAKPVRVISYAEVLYPDVKEYIGRVFGCMVHEIYKCSEGAIAMTCRYGSLHVNEDIVALELLNADGTPTPPGKPCHRLIVTDLHKSVLPIIRYELNDVITLSHERCRCGSHFRVIEKIQGRADDLFWGIRKSDGTRHFIYQDYISRTIISVSDSIEEFQAVQKDYTRIVIRLKLTDLNKLGEIGKEVAERIRKVFTDYGCEEPEVVTEYGETLKNVNSGKLCRVICEIKNI
jgi:putative adenylate-forming enzyme